jgi:hypothetical protein
MRIGRRMTIFFSADFSIASETLDFHDERWIMHRQRASLVLKPNGGE